MSLILEELGANFRALRRNWKFCAVALAGASVIPFAAPADAATRTSYANSVDVLDGYITRNGRTAKFKFQTSLNVVAGQGTPGYCRQFNARVRVKDLTGRTVSIVLNRRVTGCYSGRRYTYTGVLDLAPPQREANLFISFGQNIKYFITR